MQEKESIANRMAVIYLNPREAEFFKICWKNYDLFMGLTKKLPEDRKTFLGSITIHYNKGGKITIEKRDFEELKDTCG